MTASGDRILLITHGDCERHDPGHGQAESPARWRAVQPVLKRLADAGHTLVDAPLVARAASQRVHGENYLDMLQATAQVPRQLDYDTFACTDSWQATQRAAGAGVAAVDAVISRDAAAAFCAVRPPGHHATPRTAMGFCLLNSIAIAARHATQGHGLDRVAIVDFDVHHGNGTQDVFTDDPAVLFISTHQMPLYPGTGHPSETGAYDNVLNVAFAPETGSDAYRQRFEREVMPKLRAFAPELLLISAGFDAHEADPLAQMGLTTEDYLWLGETLTNFCVDQRTPGPVAMLEGGYDLGALSESVDAFLDGVIRERNR